jgi:hypothetical protein
MKNMNKIVFLALILGFGFMVSCEDPSLSPNLVAEGSASGFGSFLVGGKPQKDPFDLTRGDSQKRGSDFFQTTKAFTSIPASLYWASFDKKVKVNKIELYVRMTENYVDKDGNKVFARHGGSGQLMATLTPAQMYDANNFTIDKTKVYDLIKSAKFDYGTGGGSVDVFGAASGRTTADPFLGNRNVPFNNRSIAITGDDIEVKWKLYGENGLVYDSWSPSVCEEFVGTNCRVVLRVR